MAFKDIQELSGASCRRGGGSRVGDDDISFATDLASRKSGEPCYSMRIGIPTHVAKKARLIEGDRIRILFDETAGLGLIKRINGDGWKLTPTHKGGRLVVKVTLRPGMPTVAESCGCPCEITDEGIVFVLPQDVSFIENLRANRDAHSAQ